jgi:hypothetical protein
VRHLRTLSTRGLLLAVAALALAGIAAAVGVGLAGGATTEPAPEPLDQAIHDALAAPRPEGLTARVTFTNNLFPTGALAGQAGSALVSGASGRLWIRHDGSGRIELQSNAGDVQVVWSPTRVSVYDASSNTVYRAALPASSAESNAAAGGQGLPTLAEIDKALGDVGVHWALQGATPTDVGGRPAYGVSASPTENGGLLGTLRLAWEAANGTPLEIGVTAKEQTAPALQLGLRDVSYGPVAAGDVDLSPPPSASVVDLGVPAATGDHGGSVEGLAAVQQAAGFPVAAPDTLGGIEREAVRLVGGDTVIVLYGHGPGSVVVVERKADRPSSQGLSGALPEVRLGSSTGHELATQLGTALTWQAGGIDYVLAGSVAPAAAEQAARSLA